MAAASHTHPEALGAKADKQLRPKGRPQPLEAIYIDDALLEPETVEALTGLRRSARNEAISQGTFPEPIRLSATCVRWPARSIRAWLASQSAKAAV